MSSGKQAPSAGPIRGSKRSTTTTASTSATSATVKKPTVPYYKCADLPDTEPAKYIHKSHADQQMAGAPSTPSGIGRSYPKTHKNHEKNPIKAKPPLLEHPVKPNTSKTYKNGPPGPVRGVYNPANPENYGLVYHNPKKNGAFSMAESHSGSTPPYPRPGSG
ncbi:hypothetical protein QBC34DRAFT_134229 [Podospora aff. communis PSN243]|uniref:Uncharacterized protein n=1 Tax=Podospora aff. communis PSN243 TaxID=3040156 RepID=A0AAV9GGV2_9PEZI|nr:hypothetical protein QBC34DRAFT_134229 [Podospora aff. communis PSN243]